MSSLGVLLFCWLVIFCVDISLSEGMTYKSLEGENLHLFLRASLLFRWINRVCTILTVFLEIWPEHILIDKEQICVGKYFCFEYFSCDSLLCNMLHQLFDFRTGQIDKKVTKLNINNRKYWHTVNTAVLFCFDTWLICWNFSHQFGLLPS